MNNFLKRVAVIDIGSNSMRMVIYEQTSRYGFHLIKEVKTKVRIGEGAYVHGGYLQEKATTRAFNALRDFRCVIDALFVDKTICVATSAMRDAPNKNDFIDLIQKELDISIEVISGKKEAHFGAIVALNMLPVMKNLITIDIGGGSTELAHVVNGQIKSTYSLDIGTVRLKELFRNEDNFLVKMEEYVEDVLKKLPKSFKSKNVVAIGGTLRALTKSIINKDGYPLTSLHAFKFSYKKNKEHIHSIINANQQELKKFSIKKDRFDTIQEGMLIFSKVVENIEAKKITSSGAGVRDGVFLDSLFENNRVHFPKGFNLSVESLLDRFSNETKSTKFNVKTATKLFNVLHPLHKIDDNSLYCLQRAVRLASVGKSLGYYEQHEHSFYFLMQNLIFGLKPKERVLISTLVKFQNSKLPTEEFYERYEDLLPSLKTLKWLSFILTFAKRANANLSSPKLEFTLEDNVLSVHSSDELHLAKEALLKIEKPMDVDIRF